VSEFLATHQHS